MNDIKLKIFISYAHVDKKLCEKFIIHLHSLKRADLISNWYDNEINPGEEWDEEIKKNLNESDLIIFLLSPELIASEYVYKNELKLSIIKHRNNEAFIVPVMLRNCNYQHTYFGKLQGLPEGFIPIKSKKFKYIDDAFTLVIKGLERVIEKIIKDKLSAGKSVETVKESYKKGLFSTPFLFSFFGKKEMPNPLENKTNYIETDLLSKIKFLEMERREISMELHDNIVTTLISTKLYLINEFDPADERIAAISNRMSDVTNQLRGLSHSLHTQWFDVEFNLKKSLLELENHFIKISSINFNFKFENLTEFHNPIMEVNSFRIIQELLNNVIKHSQATNCDVTIRYIEKKLYLSVKDDGIGFEAVERNYNKTGLINIMERVEYYKGKIAIDSHPEKGSHIHIEF